VPVGGMEILQQKHVTVTEITGSVPIIYEADNLYTRFATRNKNVHCTGGTSISSRQIVVVDRAC